MSRQAHVPAEAVDVENAHQRSVNFPGIEFDPENKVNDIPEYKQDAFGNEEFAEVKYKIMKWWYVHDGPYHCNPYGTWTDGY